MRTFQSLLEVTGEQIVAVVHKQKTLCYQIQLADGTTIDLEHYFKPLPRTGDFAILNNERLTPSWNFIPKQVFQEIYKEIEPA